jgi:lipoprotein signal peptidase
MVKISRFILVFLGIFACSIAIPELYWTIFRQGTSTPNIVYSRVLDDFMMVVREDGVSVRKDAKGNYYTRDEFEEKLPLLFFRQLLVTGKMPDSLKGVEMNHHILAQNAGYFTIRPRDINAPRPVMWPMLESQSGRVNLELPRDYFRIKNKLEFVVAETNQVDKEKSKLFNDALIEKGFAFPARFVAGLPTAKKSIDEGYFIKDNNGDLFHVKMVKAQPYVAKIDIPSHMNITHVECVDLATQEYYAFVFTAEHEVYVLMQENYALQQIPVEAFNPEVNHMFRVRNDLLHKTITVTADDYMKVTVVDRNYEVADNYEMNWENMHERPDHILFARLFPFQLNLVTSDSQFVSFSLYQPKGVAFLIIHVLLLALSIWLLRRKKRELKKNIVDLLIVLVTGIFGFIAIRVFPNKFYD